MLLHKSKYNKISKFLLIIAGVVIVVGLLVISLDNQGDESKNTIIDIQRFLGKSHSLIIPEGVDKNYTVIFNDVSNIFKSNLGSSTITEVVPKTEMYWPIESGPLVTTKDSPGLRIQNVCKDILKNDIAEFETKKKSSLAKLDEYFLNNNYEKVENSAFTTTPIGDKYGYENNQLGIRCFIYYEDTGCGQHYYSQGIWSRDGKLVCNTTSKIQADMDLQQDYLKALGMSSNSLEVIGQYGDFYTFVMESIIGPSGVIIAKKTPAGWIKIGNVSDYADCGIVNQFKVPHQLLMAKECYDKQSGKVLLNQN